MRKELVSRDRFIEIVCENVELNPDGTAEGFTETCKAVARLKVMPPEKVAAYVKARHRALVKAGIALPIFTDIPRQRRGRQSDARVQNAIIETLLGQGGFAPKAIRGAMEHSLRTSKELNTKAKTRKSQKKSKVGQADLEHLTEGNREHLAQREMDWDELSRKGDVQIRIDPSTQKDDN